MIMVARSIVVPIFFMYCSHLSHICRRVVRRVGMRYGGNSITNGVSSFLKRVLRSKRAVSTATRMPNRYNAIRMRGACLGKNAPVKSTSTGSRALHDIKGVTSIVIMRLLRLSMVRVAIIAGTLQPKPISIGMNDFPCNPILCIRRSIMKAARAI